MIKIGLCGATGRMGSAVKQMIGSFAGLCRIEAEISAAKSMNELTDFCKASDVIIDFSSPDLLEDLLKYSEIYHSKLIIGTTGLTERHFALLHKASSQNAILYSANMSIGANLVAKLASLASKILNVDYDVEIIDTHHRLKKDSPSGTALMYKKYLSETLDDKKINISSIRGGGIIGEHDVIFAGKDEVVKIKHQALNRKIFAEGAIKAACWLHDKQNGLYSMLDVINLDFK